MRTVFEAKRSSYNGSWPKSLKKPHWTELSLKTGTGSTQISTSSMEHFVRHVLVAEKYLLLK